MHRQYGKDGTGRGLKVKDQVPGLKLDIQPPACGQYVTYSEWLCLFRLVYSGGPEKHFLTSMLKVDQGGHIGD